MGLGGGLFEVWEAPGLLSRQASFKKLAADGPEPWRLLTELQASRLGFEAAAPWRPPHNPGGQSEELDLGTPSALCLLQLEHLVKENRLGSRKGLSGAGWKGCCSPARDPASLCGGSSWGGT